MAKRLKLWWLQHKQDKSREAYSKRINQAIGDEREIRIQEAMDIRDQARDEILHLNSSMLADEAERLGVLVPPLSEKQSWESGRDPRTIRLTLTAQSRLRQAIRNEQKERWVVAAFVLKEIVTPIIGILGAIMGLLSIIHAFHPK